MLETPPILSKPSLGKPIIPHFCLVIKKEKVVSKPILVYLSISNEAISVVIVQEWDKEQQPVYFVSNLEIRYQRIKKATLTYVITIRRLQPYFQSNQIIVWMELPIKQVLRKLNLAGRMVGQTIKRLEFNTSFERMSHVKAQALVAFIVELIQVGEVDDTRDHKQGPGKIKKGPGKIKKKTFNVSLCGQEKRPLD
ncbi:hypothetical protein CR513_62541, partial [Mucuna pruriens]